MKNKKVNVLIATLAIAVAGAGLLFLSGNKIMADVQDKMTSTEEIVDREFREDGTRGSEIPDVQEDIEQEVERPFVSEEVGFLQQEGYEEIKSMATAAFVYYGQEVYVRDDLAEKDIAIENGEKIMVFLFDEIDKKIFIPYQIDKTEYTYSIQRQHEETSVKYGVFLLKDAYIQCTISICMDDGIEMNAFARDGLIDLYGGKENPIPKEYLEENWCNTLQKKEEIYDAYYESSKDIIENVLGFAPIDDTLRDVSQKKNFWISDVWSMVTFRYYLQDGTEITLSYNRINQMWEGFCIQ